MKNIIAACLVFAMPIIGFAQSDPHYTMFMYNKLIFNPAYAGSRDITSLNCTYRDQWVGIDGAPKTINISVDGPVGSYMNPFRKVAVGFSINNEKIGVETNTDIMTYYAYRIQAGSTALSFGLSAGLKLYSAMYSQLSPYQTHDLLISQDISNKPLPNFGTGIFWSNDDFFIGASIPNLLENYYDKSGTHLNNLQSKEIRTFYVSGGYAFKASETFKIVPQFIFRYAGIGTYQLPASTDFNLSFIFYDRLLIGGTYRTDNSAEGIVHLQVFKYLSMGYSYDYLMGTKAGFFGPTHEFVIGIDFVRDNTKSTMPRFMKSF